MAVSGTQSLVVRVNSAALTHLGRVRTINEDAVMAGFPVFVVADGMGGHYAGDVASAIAAEEMGRLTELETVDLPAVQMRLDAARKRILDLEAAEAVREPGTTVSGVVIVDQGGVPHWLVLNLGDSRTYRLSNGRLEQLSVDHSEAEEMVAAGKLLRDQVRLYPRRNVLTKALGAGVFDNPDYRLIPVVESDRILVCTDGLTSEVGDPEIAACLLENPDPGSAAEALLRAAMASGGRDNISIIVLDAWEVLGARAATPDNAATGLADGSAHMDDDARGAVATPGAH
ncbi:MAG: protein phosphatase 2C domain-containing protein [Bifidobacteriaceae bacterium]|jgi:protein phosphatase|nr:protein phosphatase 2C domain-containing protein [Bifidobacteriaceae bacterium]